MELTCWWNQLWIIFMNMKSITAAAQSISFIPFVFSLRMRKQIENEMKLKGIAAQENEWARRKRNKFICFFGLSGFTSRGAALFVLVGSVELIYWRVMGGTAARQQANKEDERTNENQWSWRQKSVMGLQLREKANQQWME